MLLLVATFWPSHLYALSLAPSWAQINTFLCIAHVILSSNDLPISPICDPNECSSLALYPRLSTFCCHYFSIPDSLYLINIIYKPPHVNSHPHYHSESPSPPHSCTKKPVYAPIIQGLAQKLFCDLFYSIST